MELHELLASLGRELGIEVFDDSDSFRGALDDFTAEGDASSGEINLLVDAVKLGGYRRLMGAIESGAEPGAAVEAAGDLLSRERGTTDVAGSRWACAALGYAVGKVGVVEVRRYRTTVGSDTQPVGAGEPWSDPATPPPAVSPVVSPPGPPTEPTVAASPVVPFEGPPGPVSPDPTPTRPLSVPAAPAYPAGSPVQQWPPPVASPQLPPPSGSNGRGMVFAIVLVVVFALVLVGGGVWYATRDTGSTPGTTTPPTGGDSGSPSDVPAPFESAALYDFARQFFDADECQIPEPGDAPVAEKLPTTELVKCYSKVAPFTATFFCSKDVSDLESNRRVFLSYAVDGTKQAVSGPPAGKSEVSDGIQEAFNHENTNDGRVYWDSPASLCAGEIQAIDDDNLDAVIEYWRTGK